ncbi:SWIM zinc finger family protein [Asaia prunellae]|uniref:SWIM zinc finger family protein n=1 Tax=Asaia prunellae TaxID=610245 RepID=UPI000AC8E5E7|nr:SWIM zinc finger family protein [Asaia prunellae]
MSDAMDRVARLAPDTASFAAARKLMNPSNWVTLGEDGNGLVWGECQGSGAKPYRICLSETDAGFKCTCPSRKFPCKHSLALMGFRAERSVTFVSETVPDWVQEWLSRRRTASKDKSEAPSQDKTALSGPETAQKQAQQAKTRARRESEIASGIAAMNQWLGDQLDRGLAGFDQRANVDCAILAKRLHDSKAGGLASRVARLPESLSSLDAGERPFEAARCLSTLYLIGQACLRAEGWTLILWQMPGAWQAGRLQERNCLLIHRPCAFPDNGVCLPEPRHSSLTA